MVRSRSHETFRSNRTRKGHSVQPSAISARLSGSIFNVEASIAHRRMLSFVEKKWTLDQLERALGEPLTFNANFEASEPTVHTAKPISTKRSSISGHRTLGSVDEDLYEATSYVNEAKVVNCSKVLRAYVVTLGQETGDDPALNRPANSDFANTDRTPNSGLPSETAEAVPAYTLHSPSIMQVPQTCHRDVPNDPQWPLVTESWPMPPSLPASLHHNSTAPQAHQAKPKLPPRRPVLQEAFTMSPAVKAGPKYSAIPPHAKRTPDLRSPIQFSRHTFVPPKKKVSLGPASGFNFRTSCTNDLFLPAYSADDQEVGSHRDQATRNLSAIDWWVHSIPEPVVPIRSVSDSALNRPRNGKWWKRVFRMKRSSHGFSDGGDC